MGGVMNVYQYTDADISEEAAAAFVAKVAGHLPADYTARTALRWPLTVGSAEGQPGIPAYLLDGSAALWTLPAGDDSAERTVQLDNGGLEVTKYRNGNEVDRATFE